MGKPAPTRRGRDQLNTRFPAHSSEGDKTELPAEELHLVERGLDAKSDSAAKPVGKTKRFRRLSQHRIATL